MKNDSLRKELNEVYEDLKESKLPPVPMKDLYIDFEDWDATIAGIANSYGNGAEDKINTRFSVKKIIANYEREMREKYLTYKPSSAIDKKRFDEFLAHKSKLDKVVELVKLIEKNKDGKSQRL